MNSAKINEWLQVIGLFGVIASLAFVGLQLKQTHEIAVSTNYQSRMSTEVELDASLSGNPTFLSGTAKLYLDSTDTLTPEEVVAQEYAFGSMLKIYENNLLQYEMGYLDEKHWQTSLAEMKCLFEAPFYRDLLQGWEFRESFLKVVEDAKSKAINNPSGCFEVMLIIQQ